MAVRKLFLSVGAMKAATTFLYTTLARHPELYFTPEKELHYFAHADGLSRELRQPLSARGLGILKSRSSIKGDILSNEFRRHRLSMVMHNRYAKVQDVDQLREIVRWYADRYLANPINDGWFDRVFAAAGDRHACEFSNYHALLDANGWSHVRSVCEELKVIYTLRHPVSRMWSHIKFDFIQSGRRDALNDFGLPQLEKVLADVAVAPHARYGDIVESLQKNLDSSQLKIIVFEDFSRSHLQGLAEIEKFLGVSPFDYSKVNIARKSNPTEDIPLPREIAERMLQICLPQINKLKELGVNLPQNYWEIPAKKQ